MPTILGTDGDTTGLFSALTTAQILALQTAASASSPGTMSIDDFNKLLSMPAGAAVQGVLASSEIDLLVTSTNNALAPATFAGHRFIAVGVRVVITQINGTITTGPTWNVGNDVAKTNVLTSANNSLTAAAMNTINTNGTPGFAVSVAPTGAVATGAGVGLLTSTTSSFKADITVATVANTATICKGIIYLAGFWIPL